MTRIVTVLFVLFVASTACMGVAVAEDTPTPNATETNNTTPTPTPTATPEPTPTPTPAPTDDDNVTASNIDTGQIEKQVSHVRIHDTEWSPNSVEITLSGARSDTVQVTEYDGDDFVWETYDVGREPVTIEHKFSSNQVNEVAFAVISSKSGTLLSSPSASPLSFSRGAQWSDHWVSGSTAVGMVFICVFYRYKRKQFFARTELRSLLSGRVYRKTSSDEKWKLQILRHLYSPRSLLVGVICILLVELVTGAIWSRISGMTTEAQLACLVAGIGLPAYWYVAGRILRLVPLSDQPKMVTLDNREQGGIDVLTGAKEWFDDMKVKGAKQLQKKPITGTQERAYLAHHYDSASHSAVSTWHKILDVVEVARNYTAAYVNYEMLNTEIDEAREIKSAQPALRQKYQKVGEKVAMRKMDETHFDGEPSTNDVMADVLDSMDRDEEESTVESDSLTNDEGDSDPDESEGDSDE